MNVAWAAQGAQFAAGPQGKRVGNEDGGLRIANGERESRRDVGH